MRGVAVNVVRAVKSRLYPLGLAERAAEWLIERLPRSRIPVIPRPLAHVAESEEPGEYLASGPARFELDLRTSHGGWHYLEAALVRNSGSREAWLQPTGDGARGCIPVPTNLRGTVREVFFVPSGHQRLLWLPVDSAGYFSQSPLLLHRISTAEAVLRRSYRVITDLWNGDGQSPAPVREWARAFRNVGDAYNRSALARMRRHRPWDYAGYVRRTAAESATYLAKSSASSTTFSLLMPLRAAPLERFRDSIASLRAQAHAGWELLILRTAAGSDDEAMREVDAIAAQDTRIRTVACGDASELPAALNRGLAEARGELVACITDPDLFSPDWLHRIGCERAARPVARYFYSDHDTIGPEGRREHPCFKPDWNRGLLESCDYIAGTGFFARDELVAGGGFADRAGNAAVYDATLRQLEHAQHADVRHVPRVLVHKRVQADARDHAASGAVLQSQFDRGQPGAVVEATPHAGVFRVRRPLPVLPPLVSIVVPTRDRHEFLRACIESVRRRTAYPAWELLIVDNGSTHPEAVAYLDTIACDPRCRILPRPGPFNYSALNNAAVTHARGEFVLLLNNDVEVIGEDWLCEMVAICARPGVGAVGAKLLYANGSVQHAGVILGMGGVAGHWHRFLPDHEGGYCNRAQAVQDVSAVTGACLLVRRKDYIDVGGLDEVHLPVAFNDIDFCLKLRAAGRRNVFTPHARLYHHESVSRGRDDSPAKRDRFAREFDHMRTKWGSLLGRDPAYNVNLSLESEEVRLRA